MWRCWSGDWRVQRVESSAGLETGGRSERSRLLVLRLVGVAKSLVCSSQDWGGIAGGGSYASRATGGRSDGVLSVGHGTGGRSKRSRPLSKGLVGVTSATGGSSERSLVGGSWDWWTQRAESPAGLATGGRSEQSCLLVVRLVGATRESSVGRTTGGCIERSSLLVSRLVGAARGVSSASLATGGRSERSLAC